MSRRMRANILLLITTIIWGTAFVAQKAGADIGNFTYGGIRTFLGGLVLIPVIFILNRGKTPIFAPERKEQNKLNLIGGLACGVVLFIAGSLQQFGVAYTTVAKSGFITVMYVAFVPLIGLLLGKRVGKRTWICVVLCCVGFYFLSLYGEHLTLQLGDLLVLLCAIGFSIHILVIDYYSPKCDGVMMACIQFLTAGLLGIICMFIFEEPNIQDILACWLPILYAGVLSSGVAYTLQIVAQKDAEPTQASLILCLESVFAALAGAWLLSERMSLIQYAGCAIIFAASIISNLPEKTEKLPEKK